MKTFINVLEEKMKPPFKYFLLPQGCFRRDSYTSAMTLKEAKKKAEEFVIEFKSPIQIMKVFYNDNEGRLGYMGNWKGEELNEKDFDSDIKQLMELSIKKLNLSKQIIKELEDNHINCIEDLLDTEDLENTLHDETSAAKIDKALKEFGLYRGMKYSQIELPESIIAEINLRYDD